MIQYAYCSASIAPLRNEPSDAVEMVSQLLFGEPVEIIEMNNQWRKVRSLLDNYEGWTDFKLLGELREKECRRWLDGLGTEHNLVREIEGPFGKQLIPLGACIPDSDELEFSIGKTEYRLLKPSKQFQSINRIDQALELAHNYLNTPYLWGGRSSFGIDCSSLMQNIFRCIGINLPRDCYQQVEHGIDIAFEDRQVGDLMFFINPKEHIHHVGILISEKEIIHAHGFVRIDDYTSNGIIRRTDQVLSHKYHSIKRLF